MDYKMLAGAACAALMGIVAPADAATAPSISAYSAPTSSADAAVESFYASRHGAPLWVSNDETARTLTGILKRASLDGLASGPALAAQAEALLARGKGGDKVALTSADHLLSAAWVMYVQALQRPPSGMTVADSWAAPRQQSAQEVLQRAAAAGSLSAHLRSVSSVNPIYSQLRDAAWHQVQMSGAAPDTRLLATLDRVRTTPFQDRYIMVDAASAQLWMVENGRIADSMKVIVGKPTTQTPMMASTIYYATLNPYWNVPQDLVQSLIAPRVVDQGVAYLKAHHYQVLDDYSADAAMLAPEKVDWRAVAAGKRVVKLRQLPGPANSMGQVKFAFPNAHDIYLHDTPNKAPFADASRDISNGCIRLEDAQRLSRWMLGSAAATASNAPEQHVLLPTPVPIFVTYLTAQANSGQLSFVDDVYGRDSAGSSVIAAALR